MISQLSISQHPAEARHVIDEKELRSCSFFPRTAYKGVPTAQCKGCAVLSKQFRKQPMGSLTGQSDAEFSSRHSAKAG